MQNGIKIWTPCTKNVWRPVVLIKSDIHPTRKQFVLCTFQCCKTNKIFTQNISSATHSCILYQNDVPDHTKIDCLLYLQHVHEPALLHALEARFTQNQIYTFMNDILIALNPFSPNEWLYSSSQIQMYRDADKSNTRPPHVYAIAAKALQNLIQNERNQSILISGESGSGKTETSKFLMHYLTYMMPQQEVYKNRQDVSESYTIGQKILQTNPILESFGNARTIRNDNSSRFGKLIELQFKSKELVGATFTTYLLEQVRVVKQAKGERNFHIFYELLEGAHPLLQDKLCVQRDAPHQFALVNMQELTVQEKQMYGFQFSETMRAMKDVGISGKEQLSIFQVLASILHLGNVEFTVLSDEDRVILKKDKNSFQTAAKLLEIPESALFELISTREIQVGQERYRIYQPLQKVRDMKDALIKSLYAHVFSHLVNRLGKSTMYIPRRMTYPIDESNSLTPKILDDELHHIGILDIFGFENVDHNGFEQLCINYANERLQSHFTSAVVEYEINLYQQEGIPYDKHFSSPPSCISMFDHRNTGLFALMNQECILQGTDQSLANKLYQTLCPQLETVVSASKMEQAQSQFRIFHFAGSVLYTVQDFIEKNTKTLSQSLLEILSSSCNSVLASLAYDSKRTSLHDNQAHKPIRMLKYPSTVSQFQTQLDHLLSNVSQTQTQYIRCIKSNADKLAHFLDRKLVVEQLRAAGIVQAAQIARFGYPIRMEHDQFLDTFEKAMKGNDEICRIGRVICMCLREKKVLTSEIPARIGKSIVFLEKELYCQLLRFQTDVRRRAAETIQRHMRFRSQTQIENQNQEIERKKNGVCAQRIQKCWRNYRVRYASAKILQTHWQKYRNRKAAMAASIVQRHWRHQRSILSKHPLFFAKDTNSSSKHTLSLSSASSADSRHVQFLVQRIDELYQKFTFLEQTIMESTVLSETEKNLEVKVDSLEKELFALRESMETCSCSVKTRQSSRLRRSIHKARHSFSRLHGKESLALTNPAVFPRLSNWARSGKCYQCLESFTLFTRRHHCRLCGHSYCNEHSSRRITIFGVGYDDEPVRACDRCFIQYQLVLTQKMGENAARLPEFSDVWLEEEEGDKFIEVDEVVEGIEKVRLRAKTEASVEKEAERDRAVSLVI